MRTQPFGARDGFDPHAHVGATFDALGLRRVGDDYDLRAASRCPWPVRSTHQWGRVRVPPRRDTASRPGDRLIPRADVGVTSDGLGSRIVAGDGFDLRTYEGVTPMRRSLLLLATDLAPRADVGAAPDMRRQTY